MEPAERPADPQPESRTCSKCDQTKVVAPETWVYKRNRKGRYEVYGSVCKACDLKRQSEYDSRKAEIKALVGAEAKPEPGLPATAPKLDATRALKAGGAVLNKHAPSVLARLLQYADDPDHPLHQWALDKLVDRILPRKLYEELGAQAAGVGGLNDKRPVFNIQILPAQPTAPEGRVVEGQSTLVELTPTTPEPK
jgi:hypothetical protein